MKEIKLPEQFPIRDGLKQIRIEVIVGFLEASRAISNKRWIETQLLFLAFRCNNQLPEQFPIRDGLKQV